MQRKAKLTNQKNIATLIGTGAVVQWSALAVMTAAVKMIPTFEQLAVAFSVGFILTAVKLTIKKEWYKVKQPLIIFLLGIVGIFGNDFCYVEAYKHAPPAQVDLINCLWPIFIILFSALLPRERFTWRHLLAGVFGLTGITVLIFGVEGVTHFHWYYLVGYSLALADALVWAGYSVLSRLHRETPIEMVGMYCGGCALAALLLHFQFEQTMIPNLPQFGMLILMGLTVQGLAYFCWDYGFKQGNYKFISVLSYINPVLSVSLLVIFGMAEPSVSLGIAAILVALGATLGGVRLRAAERRRIKRWWKLTLARVPLPKKLQKEEPKIII